MSIVRIFAVVLAIGAAFAAPDYAAAQACDEACRDIHDPETGEHEGFACVIGSQGWDCSAEVYSCGIFVCQDDDPDDPVLPEVAFAASGTPIGLMYDCSGTFEPLPTAGRLAGVMLGRVQPPSGSATVTMKPEAATLGPRSAPTGAEAPRATSK